MLHTDIKKHLQELSLEDTLALAKLALEQASKKASPVKNGKKKAPGRLLKTLANVSDGFADGFHVSREAGQEGKKIATHRKKALKKLSMHIEKLNGKLPIDFKFDRDEANARK